MGWENVIAGTDCRPDSRLHPELVWAKFQAMAEGARLATQQLWEGKSKARTGFCTSAKEETMKRSTERILTTHAGSLARPPDLLEMIRLKELGQPCDRAAF